MLRKCHICGEHKDESQFSRYAYTTLQGKRSVRFESRCRECNAERRRHYRQPGEQKRYRESNPHRTMLQSSVSKIRRRLRKYGVMVPDATRITLDAFESYRVGDKYLDAYTGKLIDRPILDHVVPLCKGGLHEPGNLCVTSYEVNRDKSENDLIAWMAKSCRAM